MSQDVPKTMTLAHALAAIDSIPMPNQFPLTHTFDDVATMKPGRNGKVRRKTIKWTPEEQQFVINGYCRFGPLWTEILKEYPFHPNRIHTDLRDKWENIKRHETSVHCGRLFGDVRKCIQKREDFLTTPDGEPERKKLEPFPVLNRMRELVRDLMKRESEMRRGEQDEANFQMNLDFS